MKYAVVAILIAGGLMIFARPFQHMGNPSHSPSRTVDVIVPELSPIATKGQELFNDNCAACHGDNGHGTDMGPPLIHSIYKASHHADMSFTLAVANGVRQHHWPYGNMPAQPHISQSDLKKIISFVREVQQANGIVN
ncbi:cytochrome c [Cohaesibacter sp. CAU 1516]|uniref:c-type cytochrome n=1 Tax=Cohaesibacter sp. CAU 1516 TaxID=2576038 RepID=UPI001FEE4028|nr:cytochrome c [Cohaesibacter sp. CAU 1516]